MTTCHTSTIRTVVTRAASAALFCAASLGLTAPAGAVDASVRMACASDYFAYCNMHAVGSDALRQCMRSNGSRLTPRCVDALADSGEISRADQQRHQKAQRSAQR